jgi:drug/metabolite transporter (DMT)-like permease
MEKTPLRAYLELHLSVFLFGATAIFGKLLTDRGMDGFTMVWWRMLFTVAILLLLPGVLRDLRQMTRAVFWRLGGIGVLVAIHWILFYLSVEVSNPTITLCCFATITLFTALLEPLFNRTRPSWTEVLLGVAIIPGILLVAQAAGDRFFWGLLLGLLAAFFAAVFSSLNKMVISQATPIAMTLVEIGVGWLFMTLIYPLVWYAHPPIKFWPDGLDLLYFGVFSLFCTVFSYILSLRALRHMSAFASNLTFNLEPVYGALMAAVVFQDHQQLNGRFYLGMALILATVFAYPLVKGKMKAQTQE